MIRFLADENLNNDIVRGLLRRLPAIDIVRVQDAGLSGSGDHVVLDWAADADRIVVTHDLSTLIGIAYGRVRSGVKMPGVIAIPQSLPTRAAIDDLILVATCSEDAEWRDHVVYLPLR